jgi:hypothetical protein
MAPTISHTSNIRMTALHHRINTIKVHQNLLTLFNSSNTASISMVALLLRAMINVSNIALSLDMLSLNTIKVLEDLYARSRVRGITALLREKIKAQEAMLEKDKAILRALEERYRGM